MILRRVSYLIPSSSKYSNHIRISKGQLLYILPISSQIIYALNVLSNMTINWPTF